MKQFIIHCCKCKKEHTVTAERKEDVMCPEHKEMEECERRQVYVVKER